MKNTKFTSSSPPLPLNHCLCLVQLTFTHRNERFASVPREKIIRGFFPAPIKFLYLSPVQAAYHSSSQAALHLGDASAQENSLSASPNKKLPLAQGLLFSLCRCDISVFLLPVFCSLLHTCYLNSRIWCCQCCSHATAPLPSCPSCCCRA